MFTKKSTRPALVLMLLLTIVAPIISAVSCLPQPILAVSGIVEDLRVDAMEVNMEAVTYYHDIRVNGQAMTTDPMITDVEGETYVSLRAVSLALDSEIQAYWDGHQAKMVHWGVVDIIAVPGKNFMVANERYLYVPNLVQVADGTVLVPLNTLCKAFDATCTVAGDGTFDLTRGSGAILPGSEFYDTDDLYWLSHIIHAESGNQPLSGKMAVGNVVLNRVSDSRFPSTVKGVVFQKNQFTPASSGTIYKAPSADSILAAKLCLDGAEALDDVLWFNRTGLKSWASRNATYVATIAGHTFYA